MVNKILGCLNLFFAGSILGVEAEGFMLAFKFFIIAFLIFNFVCLTYNKEEE